MGGDAVGDGATIYLDEAATTPLRRDVLEAMWPFLTARYGNPSSVHEIGQDAARALVGARERVASVLGTSAGEVTFTGGGTESDNAAVKGLALANPRGRHIVVSAVEHAAVLESAAWLGRLGFEITEVATDAQGQVTAQALAAVVRPDTTLVSVQLANNEVGTIQPVAELAAIARAHGAAFHTDAVQAAGWLPLDVASLGVDALSLSGHKIGAPKGTGVLWVRAGVPLEPLLHGGGQERGVRSGTQDVAGAVGLAVALGAVEDARRAEAGGHDATAARRDAFVAAVLAGVPGAALTGHPVERLPGHASFVLEGVSGESVLLELEARGISCSSGSACHAGSDEPSHVLTAMGLPRELAQTAVRFTFGRSRAAEDLARAADALVQAVTAVRQLG